MQTKPEQPSTKKSEHRSLTKPRALTRAEKLARRTRIAQDKARAEEWAEARWLRQHPIQIAHELKQKTSRSQEDNHRAPVTIQRTELDPESVIQSLLRQRTKVTSEIAEIDIDIKVIQRTNP